MLIAVTLAVGRCPRCGDETVLARHWATSKRSADRLCLSCGYASSDPPRKEAR